MIRRNTILDVTTLRAVFALLGLVLFVLFISTYRSTRSVYSLSWIFALGFLIVGGACDLLIGTSQQVWAVPAANALNTVGLVWAWRAARSLRGKHLSAWFLVVPGVVVGLVAALDDPARNADAAGASVYFAALAVIIALIGRELYFVDPQYRQVKLSLLLSAGLLSSLYFFRLIASVFGDFGNPVFAVVVTDTTTKLVISVMLVSVSFSMASLSQVDATLQLRAGASRSIRQLSEGALVQQKLFPARPSSMEYPIAGVCVPSQALSGDFFDWEETEEGLIITVADVMGKGVGAAMLGATIRAGLRIAQIGDPRKTVVAVMDALGDDLVKNDSFLTLFHAYLDYETGQLTVVDAGHGLALIVRSDGTFEHLRSMNLPLGLGPYEDWDVQSVTLEVEDRLIVFSDGVLDLFDGSLASIDEAASLMGAHDSSWDLSESVERIAALARKLDPGDDVTAVVLQRLAVPADTQLDA